jgi:hypothetical protein
MLTANKRRTETHIAKVGIMAEACWPNARCVQVITKLHHSMWEPNVPCPQNTNANTVPLRHSDRFMTDYCNSGAGSHGFMYNEAAEL